MADQKKLYSAIIAERGGESLEAAINHLRGEGRGWGAVSDALFDLYQIEIPRGTLHRWSRTTDQSPKGQTND